MSVYSVAVVQLSESPNPLLATPSPCAAASQPLAKPICLPPQLRPPTAPTSSGQEQKPVTGVTSAGDIPPGLGSHGMLLQAPLLPLPPLPSPVLPPAQHQAPPPSLRARAGERVSSPWAAVSGKPVMCDRGRSRGGCRQGVLLVSTLQLLPALLSSAFLQPGPNSSWPLPSTCCA